MEKKNLIRKRLSVSDDGTIDFISLVSEPAIEVDFLKFNKQEALKFAQIDEEKRIVTGLFLIPNKDIYRVDERTGEEWLAYFTAEDVRKIGQNFMLSNKNSAVNLEHETKVDSVSIIESWFVEHETDKIYALGFSNEQAPIGSWAGTMLIKEDAIWDDVKAGKFNGFSIEGTLIEQLSKQKYNEVEEILNEINNILENIL